MLKKIPPEAAGLLQSAFPAYIAYSGQHLIRTNSGLKLGLGITHQRIAAGFHPIYPVENIAAAVAAVQDHIAPF